ncbi:MAG TPA: TetR/AcrR family transcriptional regulator [Pseudonocardiaceae bacterium]|jgi:AcrR family transcriptional regulator|nr:TetR/AcrR family transcriptional regulator [Pseudonocardiaceae bacterium]
MSPRRAKAISGRVGDDPATALREHLIEVAEKMLAERQVSAITTRDIARAAGVSDGVLYNYFADKSDLLITALARRFTRLVKQFDTDLPAPGTGEVVDNLQTYALAVLELNADALPLFAGLLSEPALLQRFLAAIHDEPYGPQVYQQRVAEYLAAEQELGRIGPVDLIATTTLFTGASILLALTGQVAGTARTELAGQLPAVVRTLVGGLAP